MMLRRMERRGEPSAAYALAEAARQYGFNDVDVIDDDFRPSASGSMARSTSAKGQLAVMG